MEYMDWTKLIIQLNQLEIQLQNQLEIQPQIRPIDHSNARSIQSHNIPACHCQHYIYGIVYAFTKEKPKIHIDN
jgi:hypothetical protein